MAKLGRPTTYSEELAEEICRRLRTRNPNGTPRALRSIANDDDMPPESRIYKWLAKHEAFRQLYAHAREDQAHMLAEQCIDIADNGAHDVIADDDGNEKVNPDVVQRARLRFDARKWYAAKLNPKVYGDKVTQEVTGADGAALVPVLNVTIGKPKDDVG